METITGFYDTYISTPLLLLIILSGLFITKYTKGVAVKIKDRYKVLIASILFSFGLYYFGECKAECGLKYIITYLLATSFYELISGLFTAAVKSRISKLIAALNKE